MSIQSVRTSYTSIRKLLGPFERQTLRDSVADAVSAIYVD